jgi:large subunit ribosomal protein L2
MGRRLISQRRGKGSSTYRSRSFRSKGRVTYPAPDSDVEARVMEVLHDPGRTGLVARVRFGAGDERLVLAAEGIRVGDTIRCGTSAPVEVGNTLSLGEIPEGTLISSIETQPGSGPKLVRAGGCYASVISHDIGSTTIQMPSGIFKVLPPGCRATVGSVASGGRKEKPLIKAGKRHMTARASDKLYPRVRGVAMNAVDHPHGGGGHQHLGRPSVVSRDASPGRKVGHLAARRTGVGKRVSKKRIV